MLIDRKLSKLFSEFFIDMSKASFIAVFISAPNVNFLSTTSMLLFLTKYFFAVIVFMYLAWIFKID